MPRPQTFGVEFCLHKHDATNAQLPEDWNMIRTLRGSFSILKGKTATRVKESSCSSMELFEELHQTQKIIFQQLAAQ